MNLYPYTDFHELNDDWIIGHIKKNEKDIAALQNTIVNLNFEFDRKADKATTYTKTEVNTLLSGKVDNATLTNYYDKTETDNLLSAKADTSSLATVATSGSYNDLLNKPTIPAAQVNSDWNANSGVAKILNKPTTLSGYGITDAYTKTQVDGLITPLVQNASYNLTYTTSSLYYAQYGRMVILCGRIEITTAKPAGQSNYLFSGLPVPASGIASVTSTDANDAVIINGNGYLTSNQAMATGFYNLTGAYISS